MNAAFSIVSSCWSKTFGARQAKSKEEERNKKEFGCYLEQAVRHSFRNKDGSF